MFLRLVLFGLVFYFIYRLVFDFIIPVYKTTRQVRRGFRDMQDRMNDYQRQQGAPNQPQGSDPNKDKKPKVGEYIEFEELK